MLLCLGSKHVFIFQEVAYHLRKVNPLKPPHKVFFLTHFRGMLPVSLNAGGDGQTDIELMLPN